MILYNVPNLLSIGHPKNLILAKHESVKHISNTPAYFITLDTLHSSKGFHNY